MDRNHFQNMQKKSGRINYVLVSWHGRLRSKVEYTHRNFEIADLLNELQVVTQRELTQLSAGGEPRGKKRKEETDLNCERDGESPRKWAAG